MSASRSANPYRNSCPSRHLLELFGAKWTVLLLCVLWDEPAKSATLYRCVPGISRRALHQTLLELQAYGIVETIGLEEDAHCCYGLTELGRSLARIVGGLEGWVVEHYDQVQSARRQFDCVG